MATKYHTISLSEIAPQQSSSNYGGYTSGANIVVWYNRSSREWNGMIDGVSDDGNAYSTDTQDGFKSKQEAIDYMRGYAEDYNENVY